MPTGTLTISTYTTTPPQQVDSSSVLEIRGWYSADFISVDLVTPVFGNSTNGEQGPYYSTTPSLNSDGEIVVPAHDVQITVGANPTANYFEGLWIDGAFVMYLMPNTQGATGWQIPSVYGDPIAYDEIATYNRARRLVYAPDSYFTADQTIQEIERLVGDFAYAAVNVNGITSMDFAPADASLPISVGSNSPRVEWAIYAGNYVTSGAGTLASPYVLNVTAMLAAAGGIGIGLQGRVIIFGPHAYDVGNGIVITDQQVHLIGSSGPGSLGSTATSSTFVVSTANAPIIKYANSTDLNSFRARLENMTIMGSVTAGSSQHGVWVDNNGILMNNVGIEKTGAHGLYLTKSSVGGYANLEISSTAGDGIRINYKASADAGAGCHANIFHRISAFACTGTAFHFMHGDGNSVFGLDTENNAARGLWFEYPGDGGEARFNKVYDYWSEMNGLPDEFDGPTQNNYIGYVHNTSGATVVNSTGIGNRFENAPAYGTPQTFRWPQIIIGKDAAQNAGQDSLLISEGQIWFVDSTQRIKWSTNATLAQLGVASSTNLQVLDGAGTGDGGINLGPATDSHAEILGNGTSVDVKLGDGSAFATLTAKNLVVKNPGVLRVTPKTNDIYAATIAIDATISNHIIAAVSGTSATSTINASTGGTAGDILLITTEPDASGTVTVTFGTNLKSGGTQVTTASHFSTIGFSSDGTRFNEMFRTTNLA
jgi:hypothetical protein